MNEVGAEQVTSSVATETELDQLFDWRRYSTFNRIRNFIAYCMMFYTKQKGPLKADKIHQAEQILFRFVQTESFPNVSMSIAKSKEISKTLNVAKLSTFKEEDEKGKVKDRLKHSNFDYNSKHPILLTAEPASREVSASILRWHFRDRKQSRRSWRHFNSATKAMRHQEIIFETETT